MEAKLFEKMPYLVRLPKIDAEDNIIKRTFENLTDVCTSSVKYDLVGEIAKGAKITRASVIKILKGIKESKLYLFTFNFFSDINKIFTRDYTIPIF